MPFAGISGLIGRARKLLVGSIYVEWHLVAVATPVRIQSANSVLKNSGGCASFSHVIPTQAEIL